jgi:hypothetical protein
MSGVDAAVRGRSVGRLVLHSFGAPAWGCNPATEVWACILFDACYADSCDVLGICRAARWLCSCTRFAACCARYQLSAT